MTIPAAFGRAAGALPELEKLGKVARSLEADLFRQLLKSASPKGGLPGSSGGAGTGIYGDMWTQTVADRLAGAGSLGVANAIVRQMAPLVMARQAENPPQSPERPR